MSWLWTKDDAVAATGGNALGVWLGFSGLSIDTRELEAGDLFVALAGDNRDGHAFVGQALAAGAGAALVTHRPDGVPADAPLLVVTDTLKALEALAAAARARMNGKVIGVTGSVGKTSTKEMLRTMLAAQGRTHAAVRSFNNHWGVPLTLARMPADTDYAVIEIGMNHPGEITLLSRLARPHVALITTVAAVHLEAFGSVDEIADAKAEIFAGLEPDGVAVINVDIPTTGRLRAAAPGPVRSFGSKSADGQLVKTRLCAEATVGRALIDGEAMCFKIGAPGAHFALNAVGALLAVQAAGADIARAALALSTWTAVDGRGARTIIDIGPAGTDGAIAVLDESYNANPASVSAALAVLAATETKGRRHAYLGDMLELGPTEMGLHADLAQHPAVENIDQIHCCGPRMKALYEALPKARRGLYAPASAELAAVAAGPVRPGDICMIKGSLGAKMAPVVAALKALGTPRRAGDGAQDED
ncbi:MAG: UDP-N-acetylmuramoyl-tripeptide--D-alanyl-D-alanine ligase [Pseudomonadota bacterium]